MPLVSDNKQKLCKHDRSFRFLRIDNTLAADRLYKSPGRWVCARGCGYELNFNPEHYPWGIAYLDKPNTKCPECDGEGKVMLHGSILSECTKCGGSGNFSKTMHISETTGQG